MSIQEKQQELIDTFNLFSDWEQKYEYIIELGKELPAMPEDKKNENHLIKGCQSQVWLDAELQDGKVFFFADSDFDFISKIGLQEFLSPSRANGLSSMIKQIKFYAIAYQLKS